jgi:hypothetical protein
MIVTSRDKNKILNILKDENDFITVSYKAPEIGIITRGAQIIRNDLGPLAGKKGVYIAFTWNLNEKKQLCMLMQK